MIEIEKYARAAASTARTPPNSPSRRAALGAENAARVAAEQFVKGLEDERDELRARLAEIEAQEPVLWSYTTDGPAKGVRHYTERRAVAMTSCKPGSLTPFHASPVPAQAVPMSDEQRQGITLNAAQLRNALEFTAPDFDSDADQHKSEVTICWREVGTVVDDDGKPEPAGYVAWLSDYPEEGCIPLPESWEITPVPAQAVPDADGARFRWLCEDHSDRETRERCRSLIDRLPVMSYSDAVMSIDAAMAALHGIGKAQGVSSAP